MNSLINERQAASILSLSTRTLQRLRCVGGGPRFLRLSQASIRYRLSDLEAWISARIFSNTSQKGSER